MIKCSYMRYNWGRFYGCSDVNKAWSILFSALLDCCDKLCPVKVFNIRKDKPPWYSDDLYKLAKSRDKLFLIGHRSKDPTLLSEARHLRNTIKRDTIRFKQEYYLNLMNPKKFWQHMNDVLNNKTDKGISAIKHPDTEQLLNTPDSAELLNEYFTCITQKLVDNLPSPPSTASNSHDDNNFTNSHLRFDSYISIDKIKNTLKDFSPCKSSGCLKISSKLYLDGFEVLHEQLSFLINLSFRTGVFLTAWKKSIVTPIPKKGNRCIISNVRPISLIN